ncbi:MAG: aminopeptidase P N-terminal domain-containing protein [Synergistaceae bacterium]|nr:aminopeptidase P N-terminal domain-containing protein [Synergistaceae bacterium]
MAEELSPAFFAGRRALLAEQLPSGSVAVIFAGKRKQVSEDWAYPFTPNKSYYYFTGLSNRNGIFVIQKNAPSSRTKSRGEWVESEQFLFVDRPEKYREIYEGIMMSASDYSDLTGIGNVRYTDGFDAFLRTLFHGDRVAELYVDHKNRIFDPDANAGVEKFIENIRKHHPFIQIKNIRSIVGEMRKIKAPEEIALMRKAAAYTVEGVNRLAAKIKPGVMTHALQAEFDYYLKKRGLSGVAFQSVITTGNDTVWLHYEPSGELKAGGLVLVDIGAEYNYYASDICRIYPVSGTFTDIQRYYYESALAANERIIERLAPGLQMEEIASIGDQVLIERCRNKGLITKDEEIRNYLNHGIYHFIGLDSHDVGETCALEPGMAVSVEPGLYIKELGIGVRVEDNIVITENGNINLTQNLIKSVGDIENFMAHG